MDCSTISWKFTKLIKRSTYLMYILDVNNLRMGDQLSAGINRCVKFRWVDNVSLTLTRLLRIRSQVVSVLEVDLEYPEHLYDEHVDLSFCPTRHKPPSKQQVKLLATVYDKKRYVILYLFILCYRNSACVTVFV